MALEYAEPVRRIPVYPAADGYALAGEVAHARQQRVAVARRCPGCVEAARRRAEGAQPLSRPERARAARARWPTATACPANRIAIGNGSCDILLAAGEALLEPGAEMVYAWPSFSMYPHLAAATGATRGRRSPLDDDDRHDLDAMADEVTVATRLVIVCNPNNPTSTALPLADDRRVRRATCRATCA